MISKALNKAFSPEFLNRVDDIIMFDQLDKEAIFNIIDIELRDFYSRIEKLGYRLELSAEAKNFIAEKGYDKKYLEDELAEMMLRLNAEGNIGGTVKVSYTDGADKLTLDYVPIFESESPESNPEAEKSE